MPSAARNGFGPSSFLLAGIGCLVLLLLCLSRLRLVDARPLLEGVVAQNPKHEYGYSMMAMAETLTALGETDAALQLWKQVTENHAYPRAKVQLAEIYLARNQPDLAVPELKEVLA